jgi:hypothetical protein
MFVRAAFLESLPPPGLATTDLPRFFAKVIGRLPAAELAVVGRSLVENTDLGGYPPALGPALLGMTEGVLGRGLEPTELDVAAAARLVATIDWPRLIPEHAEVRVVRPGSPIDAELRELFGTPPVELPGVGPELRLVGPVRVVRLRGLGWAHAYGPVLCRPMDADEATALGRAWSTLEETGLAVDAAWQGRFLRLASRSNLAIEACLEALRTVPPERRSELWRAVLGHLRDGELDEAHRSSRRALEETLQLRGMSHEEPATSTLLGLATHAYQRSALDPRTAGGCPPCDAEDLDRYTAWAEVGEASRTRLRALRPEAVEHWLRWIAEPEPRPPLDPALERDLRAFRDRCLGRRKLRDTTALAATDPLDLAQAWLEAGDSRARILADLDALAAEARALDRPPAEAAVPDTTVLSAPPPLPEPPALELVPRAPPQRAPTEPKFRLPPMPSVPPPRPRTLTQPTGLGPLPTPPEPPLRRDSGTAPLATPAQAERFYGSAFRELEALERDLLERGPSEDARARILVLEAECTRLCAALGPPARSGDATFAAALGRVELARTYLARVKEILEQGSEPAQGRGLMGRLGKLIGR